MSELRTKLIERLCRIPEADLPRVQRMLDSLTGSQGSIAPEVPNSTRSDWPHAPAHRPSESGTFMVTAATTQREHYFDTSDRLALLESTLLSLAKQHDLQLEAWAVFSNHYHFIAHSPADRNPIIRVVSTLHTTSAEAVNRLDSAPGRPVWYNYWDTHLTFEKSYLARLNYVHQNAVKHGLVNDAKDYPWCSAAWFESTATTAQVKTIRGFKTDRVSVDDDYEPVLRDRTCENRGSDK